MTRLTLALMASLLGSASAHEAPSGVQYPAGCCASAAEYAWGDCAPIASRYVRAEPDGYHISLPVGAHPQLKTKGYSAVIPYDQGRPLDHEYHICLSNDGGTRYCFFVAPGSS